MGISLLSQKIYKQKAFGRTTEDFCESSASHQARNTHHITSWQIDRDK
jgi:hypothetical protein